MNARELSGLLASRAESVAAYLLPAGKRVGQEWRVGSSAGEAGKSLSVRLKGDRAGLWKDFAGDEGGDLLDLWCSVRRCSVADAMREAKQWANVRDDAPAFATGPRLYRRPDRPTKASLPTDAALDWLRWRAFNDETIAAFRIKTEGDVLLLPYIRDNELVNIKRRSLADKKRMWQEKDSEPCLFGWHLIEPACRRLAITEGEFDAMALHQAGIPALSVNQGAGNHQWIETEWERLERFSEILVCFDADEAGQKGAREVAHRLGVERCRIVTFTGHKDANEALMAGWGADLFKAAIEDGAFIAPDELVAVDRYADEVVAEFYPPEGASFAPALRIGCDHEWFRFRDSEITVWTGHNGHGKTTLLGLVQLGLIEQGEKFCVFSGEMPPRKLLSRMARQACGMAEPSIPYLRHVMGWLGRSMWLFDVIGQARSDRLLDVFAYAVRRYGVSHVVIDSLMMIEDVPEEGRGALEAQRQFMNRLAAFAKRHRVHIHLVAHPRKAEDERRAPGKQDVAGSGKITSLADNHLSVWFRALDEGDTGPDSKLEVNKQRNGDTQHKELWLWFDSESKQHCHRSIRKPRRFGDWDQKSA
jgi:twinkle protein